MRKLGIYVQVPFCQTKCTYCNFHTGVVASSRFAPYVEAVCGEIRGHRELLRAAGVDWPWRGDAESAGPCSSARHFGCDPGNVWGAARLGRRALRGEDCGGDAGGGPGDDCGGESD